MDFRTSSETPSLYLIIISLSGLSFKPRDDLCVRVCQHFVIITHKKEGPRNQTSCFCFCPSVPIFTAAHLLFHCRWIILAADAWAIHKGSAGRHQDQHAGFAQCWTGKPHGLFLYNTKKCTIAAPWCETKKA